MVDKNLEEIEHSGQIPSPTSKNEVDIHSLPSVQSVEGLDLLSQDFLTFISTDLSATGKVMRIGSDGIELDQQSLDKQREQVSVWLNESIISGDEKTLGIYLRNVDNRDDDANELSDKIREAFEKNDPSVLNSVRISGITNGIAERNLIREGIKAEIPRLPFVFRDRQGNQLNLQEDIDIIFTQKGGRGGGYKFVIGSKKGIESITFPEELPSNMFKPDITQITKSDAGAIMLPIGSAADGTESPVVVVDIRKGPIDLSAAFSEEEERKQAPMDWLKEMSELEKKRNKSNPPSPQNLPTRSPGSYSPPAPRQYSGESRYISSSG